MHCRGSAVACTKKTKNGLLTLISIQSISLFTSRSTLRSSSVSLCCWSCAHKNTEHHNFGGIQRSFFIFRPGQQCAIDNDMFIWEMPTIRDAS